MVRVMNDRFRSYGHHASFLSCDIKATVELHLKHTTPDSPYLEEIR